MAHHTEWGDEVTLKAFCDLFGVVVHVVLSTGTRWYHKYTPKDASDSCRHVFLSYLSPVHYDSVVLAETQRPEAAIRSRSAQASQGYRRPGWE